MRLARRQFLHLTGGAIVLPAVAGTAWAQAAWPTKPVHIISGFAAGGGVDITARLIGQWLSERLGQNFVIEDRPGADGNIGTEFVVNAAPDGYTLLLATVPNAVNATLYPNLKFNFIRDIAPVSGVIRVPMVALVNPSVPATTIPEFIAYAKANPGKVNMASAGTGSAPHMAGELFKAMAGVDATIVLYKGTGPLTNDLLGGQVPVAFNVMAPAMGNLQAGTLRAMAVLGPQRSSLLPDVPTAAESGLPGFEAMLHYGLLAPAGTPKPIVARLNAELRKVVDSEDVKQRIHADGGDMLVSTPEEYSADIDQEEKKWSALIRKLGLRVE